mgnify:CR=1 FL=1
MKKQVETHHSLEVAFTKLSDFGSDKDIDDFDWSDINKNGEKQLEYLYKEYVLDQIQVWMRSYLDSYLELH